MSVQDDYFTTLREEIITLARPPGAVLSVYELANRFGISRTPVREALIRLSAQGLVEILPQRKTLVSRIDSARVGQERFLREALEVAAIPGFLARITDTDLLELRALSRQHAAAAARGDAAFALSLDDAFHRRVFLGADQALAWQTIDSQNGHYRRLRLLMMQGHGEIKSVVEEHNQLIDAYEARDERLAVARTKAHLMQIALREAKLRAAYPSYFT